MHRLALVADTHSYQAGLPRLLRYFHQQGLTHLACLGDCAPEPFKPWLDLGPRQRLFWVYDFYGPDMPEASSSGMALKLPGEVYLAHTRALIWTHFKKLIATYQQGTKTGRLPMLLCHGHTHVPSVTQFTPPASRLLYINDAVRPQEFRPNQACVALERDCIYLIVPGAFTLEEGRFPTFSFAIVDLTASRVAMVSLRDLGNLESLELFPP